MDSAKTKSLLQEQLQQFALLRSSNLKKEEALQHINYYREDLPKDAIKSVWLDREIIDFISKNADTLAISGLRVYMARYKEGVPPVDEDPARKDQLTVIVAPTTTTGTDETDLEEGYFDYGRPCPPSCNGDAGTV